MTDPIEIRGLQPVRQLEFGSGIERPQQNGADRGSFADMLSDAINSVDDAMKSSDQQVQDFVAGKTENVHDVMISMQRAQLSFQMMVEVRNKAIETYHEISRMQI